MASPTRQTVEQAEKMLKDADRHLQSLASEADAFTGTSTDLENSLEDAETKVTIAKARRREAKRQLDGELKSAENDRAVHK